MPHVFRSLEEIGPNAAPSALTIGNFDGVHLGHRHLFERIVQIGRENAWVPSVLTFDPHPTRVVAPERAPKLLSTPEQRFHWMEEAGIEQVFVLPFNNGVAHLSPEEFVRDILLARLNVRAVIVGDNFRFGNRQAGDVKLLSELGRRYGFITEVVHGIKLRGRMVSSTELRRLIQNGDVSIACRLLGRPYALEGFVVRGHGIGSKETVPTLNLSSEAEILPANGVYVTRTYELGGTGREWPSITNVGTRPTFNGTELTIETYLLADLRDARPDRIRVDFLFRLRDELKFPSAEALKAQIMRDVARAQAFHRRVAALGAEKRPV